MDPSELRRRVADHLKAENPEGALEELSPIASAIDRDRDLAILWASLLARAPGREGLVDEAARILDRWPADPEVVIAANSALIACASRRPLDEPLLRRDGPAQRAAEAALQCLAALEGSEARDASLEGYLWINRANALRLAGPDRDAEAREAFDRALALDPENGNWWFDLGLLHKWRGRFREGLDANLRARARLGETRAIQWNLAICATAIGDGDLAAGVFKSLGMPADLAPSGMPFVDGLPPMQVRVISRGSGIGPRSTFPDRAASFEVVWVAPLSPCHGVVQSPTFRDAPIDYGDLVLWDGAPVGFAEDAVPRFPLLEILNRGSERKLRFVALTDRAGDLGPLETALPPGCLVFTQSEKIESARPARDHGAFLVKPSEGRETDGHLLYGKIVVPPDARLDSVAESLRPLGKAGIAIAVPELFELLGDTKRAGQEHQAFRGIERRADKRLGTGVPNR